MALKLRVPIRGVFKVKVRTAQKLMIKGSGSLDKGATVQRSSRPPRLSLAFSRGPGAALQGVGANSTPSILMLPISGGLPRLSSPGTRWVGLFFGITEHSITRHRISESTIQLTFLLWLTSCCFDQDREMICASFTCPYCWREGDLIDAVQSGEQIVVFPKRMSLHSLSALTVRGTLVTNRRRLREAVRR